MESMAETEAAPTTREEIAAVLFDLFRRAGYDAVSIADISGATGLGKSSLYHHFPGGKPDMGEAVADFAGELMNRAMFAPLRAASPFARKIRAMMKTVADMYDGGGAPCLISSMMISPSASPKAIGKLRAIIKDWIDAIADALRAEGVAAPEARMQATRAVICIQGALVVARAVGDRKIFATALKIAENELLE